MDERGVEERLARLEERLARLEQRLGASPQIAPPARPPVVPMPAVVHTTPPPPVRPPVPKPPPLPRVVPRPVVVPSSDAGTLEAQVGLKWAGWVGAIIVVIGAALGIKYAYDQNWFGALSPAARLALMSLGGFGLIAAGEVVYRRVGMVASAGLFGAGVATLFVVSYAGYGYFDLYEREAAYALMALCTLIGAAVAVRGNLVSIAVLSIVGGNVAPIALRSDEARLTALLTYVLAMQVVALVLAWWGRGPKWWTLRGVALATICLWMAVPVLNSRELWEPERHTALVFALIYAALFHVELVLSSLRAVKPNTTRDPGFAVPVPLGRRDDAATRQGLGVTFSLLVTAALTIAVLMLRLDRSELERGAWVVGLGACCLALGLALPRLARGKESLALGLAIGYRIQAAALLVVAVPVTLSGMWITIAWATLALALALVGAKLNLGVSRVAAVLIWMLAASHLGVWSLDPAAAATWAVLLGQPIPAYLVLAAAVAVVGHTVAALVREDWSPASAARATLSREHLESATLESEQIGTGDDGPHSLEYERRGGVTLIPTAGQGFAALASFADVLAVLVFSLAVLAALPRVGLTFAVVCYAWALIGAGQIVRSATLHPMGLALLLGAALKWMLFDTLEPRLSLGMAGATIGPYRPVYNPAAAVGAALFVSGLALRRVPLRVPSVWGGAAAREASERAIRAAGGFAAVLVALWGFTLEIDRYYEIRAASATAAAAARDYELAKHVAISIVWSLYAVGCVVVGFAARVAGLRYFGLALFALTVGKVMLVDLRGVGAGYRTLSFLGLGLLLLGTSVLYGKLSPRLLGREPIGAGDWLNPGAASDDKVGEAP